MNKILKILTIVFITGIMFSSHGVHAADLIFLTNNNTPDENPSINGGKVAWDATAGSTRKLAYYDTSNGNTTYFTQKNTVPEKCVDSNGNLITRDYDINNIIQIFLINNSGMKQISNNLGGNSNKISTKCSNGNKVTWWEEYYGTGWGFLKLYDGNGIKEIGSNAREFPAPTISDGDVVWKSYAKSYPSRVHLFSYKNETTTDLFEQWGIQDSNVVDYDVDGNNIVFSVWNNASSTSDTKIFLYNGLTVNYIANCSAYNCLPELDNGSIVWSDNDGHDREIFLYKNGGVKQLTQNDSNDAGQKISGNYVVWQNSSLSSPYDPKIFLYDGENILQISTPGRGSYTPDIYNKDVVWKQWDGTDNEIVLYKIPPKTPSQFFSQIQNSSQGWLNLRKTAGSVNKPADDVIKTLPNGWAIKVLNTLGDNNNNVDIDSYRWYKVGDVTDGAIGWMVAKNLLDNTVYLNYDAGTQSNLQNKSEAQLATPEARKPAILDAINSYHAKDNSDNSLYGGGGGLNSNNNFQRFIIGSNFPKELALAISAQESSIVNFDNERCSLSKDGGIGIMQITSSGYKGLGSGLDSPLQKNDCYLNYIGNLSKYYSNSLQGIYANIKDGFRVLQDKYRQKCPQSSMAIGGYTFSCQDIEKVLNVWAYNGLAKDKDTGLYTGNYLKYISNKLGGLGNYFSGVSYPNNDNLVEKLAIANNNKQVIKIYSPGYLQVIDSQDRITGLANNETKEEIPNSLYDGDAKGAVVFFPGNINHYRVVGTDTGEYGLSVNFTDNGAEKSFSATSIPTTPGETHDYYIDWDVLVRGERGVTLNIDKNGDGVTDLTVISDNYLYDIEPPTITVGATQQEYLLNSSLAINFSASDNVSGITNVVAILNNTSIGAGQTVILDRPGINTLKVTATDNDGNISISTTTFRVVYNFAGFLPPIKTDGSGVYNQGRTLPVKFQLTDNNGVFMSSAMNNIYVAKISNGVIGTDEIPLSSSSSDTGNQFRYDPIANQYIFNLNTSTLSAGTWWLKTVLDDGKEYGVLVSIR